MNLAAVVKFSEESDKWRFIPAKHKGDVLEDGVADQSLRSSAAHFLLPLKSSSSLPFTSIIQLWETAIVRDKANCFSDGSQSTIVAYCWRLICAAEQIPEKPLI